MLTKLSSIILYVDHCLSIVDYCTIHLYTLTHDTVHSKHVYYYLTLHCQDILRLKAMDSGNIQSWRQQLDSLMYALRQVNIRYQVLQRIRCNSKR